MYIFYLCIHSPGFIWRIFSLIPKNMPVFQPFAFHIIFLILWLLLAVYNFPMKSILLRFRAGIYPIMHFFFSISAQICCKIKLVYFWVHLNTRSNCVIFENLSWYSLFQDTTNNHASGCILVFGNFPKSYFIGAVKESWRYTISYLLPS